MKKMNLFYICLFTRMKSLIEQALQPTQADLEEMVNGG